jgi:hypothetical protein
LHKYLYGHGNPVNFADPRGLYAQVCDENYDAYNLTDWLVREMHHQSTHWPVRGGIATLNLVGHQYNYPSGVIAPGVVSTVLIDALTLYIPGRAYALSAHSAALVWWAKMVGDGLRWDFKDDIQAKLGDSILLCDHKECKWYERSMPGNIFYAYVGRVAGFGELDIRFGAIYAQQRDPENDPALNDWFLGLDQASDQAAIELGFEMYGLTRGSSNETAVRDAFKTALGHHGDRLAAGSEPTSFIAPEFPVGPDGPRFPLGHFDGTNVLGWLGQ